MVQAGSHTGAGDFVLHIQDLLERAKAHLLKAQEYQKTYFDCHHRHQEHQVGDWVLLNTSNLHLATVRKLRQWCVGPFKVLQRVGKTAYKLDLQGRFTGVHNVFHVSCATVGLQPQTKALLQPPLVVVVLQKFLQAGGASVGRHGRRCEHL